MERFFFVFWFLIQDVQVISGEVCDISHFDLEIYDLIVKINVHAW